MRGQKKNGQRILWLFSSQPGPLGMFWRFIKHSNDVYINKNNTNSVFRIIIMKLKTKTKKTASD